MFKLEEDIREAQEQISSIEEFIDLGSIEEEKKDRKDFSETIIKKSLSSQQIEDLDAFYGALGGEGFHDPPYDLYALCCFLEKNSRLTYSVHLRARQTIGLGWSIVENPSFKEVYPLMRQDLYSAGVKDSMVEKIIEMERLRFKRLFLKPNNYYYPFTELCYRYKMDRETCGNGLVEIFRDGNGSIMFLNHIPAHTVRKRTRNRGFVQIRENRRVYFKNFGDNRIVNKNTGEQEDASLPFDDRATELIHSYVYSPRSSFYGIPRWVSAITAISGNRLAAERNLSFFENDAVGRLAIIVSGGRLDSTSVKHLRDFVTKKNKGPNNAHRVMVLQAEGKKTFGVKGEQVKIEVVPLTIGRTDDESHTSYRKTNNEEVREVIGVGSAFYTSDNVNKSSSTESKKITIEQEFIPDARAEEFLWNNTVMSCFNNRGILDVDGNVLPLINWDINPSSLRFKRPEVHDLKDLSEILSVDTKSGNITINEARKELGRPPLPKEFKWADLPMAFAMVLFQTTISEKIQEKLSKEVEKGNFDLNKVNCSALDPSIVTLKNFDRHVTSEDMGNIVDFEYDAIRKKIEEMAGGAK